MNLSLRAKGILALVALTVYVALVAAYVAQQRRDLEIIGQQLESHRSLQTLLAPTVNMLAHTLVQTQAVLSSPAYTSGTDPRYAEIAANLDPLLERLQRLQVMDADIAQHIGSLDDAVEVVRTVPSGTHLAAVRNAEQQLIARFNDILGSLDRETEHLAQVYRRQQHKIGLTAIASSIVGATASATLILTFFTRLARDIERLRARASAIVSGYSGAPLDNHRHDEVGGLIDAVNRMQVELRRWERQQEIGRQQRFHQEKMAAVGSMASAIGHEVNNPIAAIAGGAQFLIDETRGDTHRLGQLAHDFGVQTLRQTERISLIMRQLADLTRPASPEPELLDLNSLVRSTCNFIGYDKRFRGIVFDYGLDHDLPAATAVADHVTQVLMNLLINAADSMEDVPKDGTSQIHVGTAVVDGEIRLVVADTGHGMTPAVQARAFEESFTTKPAGRGRGIGLFLCKTLIERAAGRIELQSQPGAGTEVRVFLPLPGTGGADE